MELSVWPDNNCNGPINDQPPEYISVDGSTSALAPNSTELDTIGERRAGSEGKGMDIDR